MSPPLFNYILISLSLVQLANAQQTRCPVGTRVWAVWTQGETKEATVSSYNSDKDVYLVDWLHNRAFCQDLRSSETNIREQQTAILYSYCEKKVWDLWTYDRQDKCGDFNHSDNSYNYNQNGAQQLDQSQALKGEVETDASGLSFFFWIAVIMAIGLVFYGICKYTILDGLRDARIMQQREAKKWYNNQGWSESTLGQTGGGYGGGSQQGYEGAITGAPQPPRSTKIEVWSSPSKILSPNKKSTKRTEFSDVVSPDKNLNQSPNKTSKQSDNSGPFTWDKTATFTNFLKNSFTFNKGGGGGKDKAYKSFNDDNAPSNSTSLWDLAKQQQQEAQPPSSTPVEQNSEQQKFSEKISKHINGGPNISKSSADHTPRSHNNNNNNMISSTRNSNNYPTPNRSNLSSLVKNHNAVVMSNNGLTPKPVSRDVTPRGRSPRIGINNITPRGSRKNSYNSNNDPTPRSHGRRPSHEGNLNPGSRNVSQNNTPNNSGKLSNLSAANHSGRLSRSPRPVVGGPLPPKMPPVAPPGLLGAVNLTPPRSQRH